MSAPLASLVLAEESRMMNSLATLRRGQAAFNALGELDPVLCKSLIGTDADCFYDDRKIGAFYAAVMKA